LNALVKPLRRCDPAAEGQDTRDPHGRGGVHQGAAEVETGKPFSAENPGLEGEWDDEEEPELDFQRNMERTSQQSCCGAHNNA
jgi:hypothetical protein